MSRTVVRYEPRGGAVELLHAVEPEILLSGPAGTGKSVAALYRLHLTALNVPDCRLLICRQTHVSLAASTLETFKQEVAKASLANGDVKWYGGSGSEPPAFLYPNGSKILVGGLDKPERLLSTSYDMIFVDEANQISLTAFETLVTRLRGSAGIPRQIITCCNPDRPDHWLKRRCDAGDTRIIHSRHADNPRYTNADGTLTEDGQDYMSKLDRLTGVRRARYRDGIWAAAEGVIYEEWDEGVHVVTARPVPADWPLYLSVDFGFTNPMVVGWWRQDPDGRLYLVREIYRTQTLVEDHAREIRRIMDEHPDEPLPTDVICDHDAEDRATLEKHLKLPTRAANKSVSRGIQAVKARLSPAADGRPRLYVFRDVLVSRDSSLDEAGRPASLMEEVGGYVWAVKPGNAGGLKEAPVKEDDHACDAMRYVVATLDLTGRMRAHNPARATAGGGSVRTGSGPSSLAARYGQPVGR